MTRERRLARETLDTSIFDMAVLGGGGERLEAGLRLGRLAVGLGDASLIDVESLPAHADLVAIATFSTSAGDETPYRLARHKRAIQLLAANIETSIAGMVNCGSGEVDTMRAGQGNPVVSRRRACCHPACIRSMLLLPAAKEVSLSNYMIRLRATTPRWVTAMRAI